MTPALRWEDLTPALGTALEVVDTAVSGEYEKFTFSKSAEAVTERFLQKIGVPKDWAVRAGVTVGKIVDVVN